MDLDSFLVSLYVLVDDWWKLNRASKLAKIGRPALLSDSEIITLAILAQWPRFRSERDFWRFASSHLRSYFPNLSVLKANSTGASEPWSPSCALCSTPLPENENLPSLRLCLPRVGYHSHPGHREGESFSQRVVFCGQATFGRSASKTEWIYGFKMVLTVSPEGVITAFGVAEAASDASDERPIGDWIIRQDRHNTYLADKGFSSVSWERHWVDGWRTMVFW